MIRLSPALASLACALALASPAADAQLPIQADVNEASLTKADLQTLVPLGSSSFYVSIFHVYDAELSAPVTGFDWDEPFRLKLTYARKISAKQLVNVSLKEMARVFDGEAADYENFREPLSTCFRDVRKGDVIEGVSDSRDTVRFYFNGEQTCELGAPDASYQFFSIWLSEQSRSPKQTRRLLGQ